MNNTFRYVHKQEPAQRKKTTIRNDNSPGKSMKWKMVNAKKNEQSKVYEMKYSPFADKASYAMEPWKQAKQQLFPLFFLVFFFCVNNLLFFVCKLQKLR